MPGEPWKALCLVHDGGMAPSKVVTHKLCGSADGGQMFQGASGYSFHTDMQPATSILQNRLLKRVASLAQLLDAFQNGQAHRSPASTRPPGTLLDYFIARPDWRSEERESDMTDIFVGVQFDGWGGPPSKQYIETRFCHIRRPCPAPNQRLATTDTKPHCSPSSRPYKSININTGMCMFSRSALAPSAGDTSLGRSSANRSGIPPLPSCVDLTLYELEMVARLSTTIADILYTIHGGQEQCGTQISVNIDLPDLQYHWTACDLFRVGLVDVNYVRKWMAAIELRRNQLGAALIEMISAALAVRGLSGMDVTVQLGSGTEEAVALLKARTAVGQVPTLSEVIGVLRERGSEAGEWQVFLDSLEMRDRPSSVADLGKLMYIFKTVKSVLVSRTTNQASTSHASDNLVENFIIQINDITDWRIYDKSKSFLKRYCRTHGGTVGDVTIAGVFPLQRVFLAGSGRSNLYEEESAYGYAANRDADVPSVDPLDIVSQTYGADIAQQLQNSLLANRVRQQPKLSTIDSQILAMWAKSISSNISDVGFGEIPLSYQLQKLTNSTKHGNNALIWCD